MKAFITYDTKTEQYSVPVFFNSEEEAKRAYAFAIRGLIGAPENVDKSLLYFKKDISLYIIGEYDEDNGFFTAYKSHKEVGNLSTIFDDFKNSYMTDSIPSEEVTSSTEVVSDVSAEPVTEDIETNTKKISLKKKEVMENGK